LRLGEDRPDNAGLSPPTAADGKNSMQILSSELFPTLVWTTVFDDQATLNARLLDLARRFREQDPAGVQNTNMLGWQSRNVIQSMEEFRPINDRILAVCRQIAASQQLRPGCRFDLQAWVNISPPGASNAVHFHPNSHLSGVYYVQTPEGCGEIFFKDPRTPGLMYRPPIASETTFTATEVALGAEAGRMYVFPSWLEHGVRPNRSTADRVGISFNVRISDP
jgi:uncharacterized protein (TIGR02466 family)